MFILMKIWFLCFEVVLKGSQSFVQARRCVESLCSFVFYAVVVLDAHSVVIFGGFEDLA